MKRNPITQQKEQERVILSCVDHGRYQMYKTRPASTKIETVRGIIGMWWSALILIVSLTAADITLPISVKFDEDVIDFSNDTNSVSYTISRQDGSTFTGIASLEEEDSSLVGRNTQEYSVNDCTSLEESCISLTTNDFSLSLKKDLGRNVPGYEVTLNRTELGIRVFTCLAFNVWLKWYGGPLTDRQLWPIQDGVWNDTSYLPKHDNAMAITEPYWIASDGTLLRVYQNTSLMFNQRWNISNALCLGAENTSPYREREFTVLRYAMAWHTSVRDAHEAAVGDVFAKPTGIPNERMITLPIWSTWARYKSNVNDVVVREYAKDIIANGFKNGQLEIDDSWESCYGSLTFDTRSDKFPDVKGLTSYLRNLGFKVTLWVHPFVNVDCTEYHDHGRSNGYFVQNVDGNIYTSWWRGKDASVIDFTNPAAVEWFNSRLYILRENFGIDSFKFDAGETSWLPEPAVLTGNIEDSPGIFTSSYTRSAATTFGNDVEVRTGWQTQDLPIFVSMRDKESSWTVENGLATLIPSLLTMNVAGYGFVIPDKVGGNGYVDGNRDSTQLPSKELFIRWLQATTFMPAIRYSFAPWDYDDETVAISRTYTELHERFAVTIVKAMNDAVINGTPVNPPLWWLAPRIVSAFEISDQYLLGEYVVVAPVVEEGAEERDIFLPEGMWHDGENQDVTYTGPIWLYNYSAPLDTLPFFVEENYLIEFNAKSGAFLSTSSLLVVYACALLTLTTKLQFN